MKTLVLLLFFACSSLAQVDTNFSAPVNLTAQATAKTVGILWEHELDGGRFLVNLSDGQSEFTEETQIAFGDLEPNTTYTATVVLVDDEGNRISPEASVQVLTRNGEVQGLQVVAITNSSITIEWTALDLATGYIVSLVRESSGEAATEIETTDTRYELFNLMPSTYYQISVLPTFDDGDGNEITIRARTDGPGQVVVMFQWQRIDDVIGGQAEILRPINIPNGPYNVQVNFSCPLRRVEVWNAELNMEASNFEEGVVVVTQSQVWELEKTEIGMNFFFNGTTRCSFDGMVSADFGIILQTEEDEEEEQEAMFTDLRVQVNEWFTNSLMVVDSAGTVNVWMTPPFNVPQPHMMDVENPKPSLGTFVIAVSAGDDCVEGFNVQDAWGFIEKDTSNVAGAEFGTSYFVQERDQWYSPEAGLLYGYDPFTCRSRSITAQLISGDPIFIQDIHDAPNA